MAPATFLLASPSFTSYLSPMLRAGFCFTSWMSLGTLLLTLSLGSLYAEDAKTVPVPPPLPLVPPGVQVGGPTFRTNRPAFVRPKPNVYNDAQPAGQNLNPPLPGNIVPPGDPPAPLAPRQFPTQALQPPSLLPPNSLAWDAESKDYQAKIGDTNAVFVFWLTNVFDKEVLVNSVRTSCGCTVAKLPSTPWHIPPGSNGPIEVTVDLRGKRGKIVKTVTADTTAGVKSLLVSVNIPVDPKFESQMNRSQNMQLAGADRQIVFRGDCARCHVEPARGKMGHDLYVAACGVCHEAEHRASMVPDLKALKHPTDLAFWTQWTKEGKPGTLMPAFAAAQGGPLSDEQIASVAEYLAKNFQGQTAQTAAPNSAPPPVYAPKQQ